jgi:hypothetical protein
MRPVLYPKVVLPNVDFWGEKINNNCVLARRLGFFSAFRKMAL